MRYFDYMKAFTASDEAKQLALSRAKALQKQLASEQTAEKTAAQAPAKRKSTFRLHPKRWISIFVAAAVLLTAVPTVYFTVLRPKRSIRLNYMKNMMVDVDGVTAYSIRKDYGKTASSLGLKLDSSEESEESALSLLSASLVLDEGTVQPLAAGKGYNYLYSTTEEYEAGNVEYDENGVQKVTFKKNTEITEEVYDDKGNLITTDRKITQEELDAQVNKIYTTGQFTFVQFVAKVKESGWYRYRTADGETGWESVELRPENSPYDEHGVADFDKRDYYSNHLTAVFVIDNFTGYIYKIENILISYFENGLIYSGHYSTRGYYSIRTDEENNLVITNLMPNSDISVRSAFQDKYGWAYVWNNRIDKEDRERKIIYFTGEWQALKYAWDSAGNAYLTDGLQLTHRIIDGVEVPYDNKGIVKDLKSFGLRFGLNPWTCGMYENLIVYMDGYAVSATLESGFKVMDGVCHWVDGNWDTIIALGDDGRLYYKSVHLSDYLDNYTDLSVETDFIRLSDFPLERVESYTMYIGDAQYKINDVYRDVGMYETKYFHVVRTETGFDLVELTTKSYAPNVFIFQPINK